MRHLPCVSFLFSPLVAILLTHCASEPPVEEPEPPRPSAALSQGRPASEGTPSVANPAVAKCSARVSYPRSDIGSDVVFDPSATHPVTDHVMAVGADWVVWCHSIVVPETAGLRVGVSFDLTYYIERLGKERRVSLAYGEQARLSEIATLLPNEALLVCRGNTFAYAAAGHEPMTNGKAGGSILAVFPDGAVVGRSKGSVDTPDALQTLTWVAVGREFDWISTQLGEIRHSDGLVFNRVGDKIVWIADGSDDSKTGRHTPHRLFLFNVSRADIRQVIDGRSPLESIAGFDGRSAFDGMKVINIQTRAVNETSDAYKEFHRFFYRNSSTSATSYSEVVVSFLDGMVYLARETGEAYELMAVPYNLGELRSKEVRSAFPNLKREEGKPIGLDVLKTLVPRNVTYRLEKSKLSRIPKDSRNGFRLGELFFVHDNLLRVWDGTTWIALPESKVSAPPATK